MARDVDKERGGTGHSTPNPNPQTLKNCVKSLWSSYTGSYPQKNETPEVHLQRSDVMHHECERVDVHGVVV